MSFVNSKIPAGIFSFVSEPKCKVYYPQVPICCCQNSDLEVDKKMTCQKATGSVLDPNACASGFSRMEMPKSNKCSDLEVEKFEPYDTKTNFSLTTSALVEKASKSLNPMGFKSVNALLGRIIYILMSIIGTIALVMYIYAGVLWMGAAGQADRITSAKNILVWTSLGVITSLSSYIIVKYIFDILSS